MATKVGIYSATHESVTVARGQRKENTDRAKNQSGCTIRYRALSEKKKKIMIIIIIVVLDVVTISVMIIMIIINIMSQRRVVWRNFSRWI